jgi:hypothetical protein
MLNVSITGSNFSLSSGELDEGGYDSDLDEMNFFPDRYVTLGIVFFVNQYAYSSSRVHTVQLLQQLVLFRSVQGRSHWQRRVVRLCEELLHY